MAFDTLKGKQGENRYELITPRHEIDVLNGEDMRKYISKVINDVDAVILDLSKIAYINSSGLREMIQIIKFLNDNGKKLYLAALPEDLRKVFTHTNLDRLFSFYPTLQDAINTLS